MASDFAKRHLIVGTSNVKSTKVGHIYSIKDTTKDMDNGELVLLGNLISGEREIYAVKTPAKADKGVTLVNTPPLIYEQYTTLMGAEYNFYNKANETARSMELAKTDIFEISIEAVTPINSTTGVVPNNFVINDGNRRLKEVATLDGTEGFVGQVLFTRSYGAKDTRVFVKIIQN